MNLTDDTADAIAYTPAGRLAAQETEVARAYRLAGLPDLDRPTCGRDDRVAGDPGLPVPV